MQVLVTGCAGFIGSHLAEALLARGHTVVGVDCFTDYYSRQVKEENLAAVAGRPGFRFHELDLRTDRIEDVLDGCQRVAHLAAMPGLPRSWTEIEAYTGCNLIATARLADAAAAVGVDAFVQASTSSVYGRNAVGDESMPTRPVSPYGVTKLAAEHLLMAHHEEQGLPVVVLRYFSIYGPRQRPDMAYHLFAESLLDGRPLVVHGDGTQSRSSTYVADCVLGTVQALEAAPVGEVFNIGGGAVITVREALAVMSEAIGVRPHVLPAARRPGDQQHTAADTSKARRVLGYAPTTDPCDGLLRQLEWHVQRRQPEGELSEVLRQDRAPSVA